MLEGKSLHKVLWKYLRLQGSESFVSTTEELLERKSSGSGLENREYGRKDPSRGPRGTLYPQKSALTSPKRRSLGRYSSVAN
jgi:hypothetical protein